MNNNRLYRIEHELKKTLLPLQIEVLDESHNHHVPLDSESHFKVTIVSLEFESISLVKRHQQINNILKQEFKTGMHALAIHAYTPNEWQNKINKSPGSPKCLDGFKNNI